MKRSLLLAAILLLGGAVFAQNGTYISVLKVPALENAPGYFYINTKIPVTDNPAPQLQVTGYLYGNSTNKAMKFTLGWYRYQGNFYWAQFHSDLGYQKPSRVRLGTYTSGGTDYVRVEISNDGGYWANYTISATDRSDCSTCYTGWSYAEGEMPTASTAQIGTVPHQADIFIDGKLGIGISNPTEKLAVNGTIRAKEVKVETTNWPDYVFEEGYKVEKLEKLESYIKANKHLPGIPSAEEVEKEGISLGEMNAKLLQKIEEMILHIIEQNKMIKQQNERIIKLENKP